MGCTGNDLWRRGLLLYRKCLCEEEEEEMCDRNAREVDLHKGIEPIRLNEEEREESLEKGLYRQ